MTHCSLQFFLQNLKRLTLYPFIKRRVSLSKIYERCMFDQMYCYFNQILSKHQSGFRQSHNTQHSLLLLMVEKLKKSLDNRGVGGMLLTDLSKAFYFQRQDLSIAKLTAYGFDQPALCFIFSYLSDRAQGIKVNNAYSSYTDVKNGAPSGSILGSLLSNIDICDLFL